MSIDWKPISRPLFEADRNSFEVVVIGSGYGGGVAASRIARAGRDVALLERGREIAPGDYPRDPKTAAEEFQITLSGSPEPLNQRRDCLYDLRVGEHMSVLLGCGLGGTSLINANVAIEPDKRVYRTWPEPFRSDPDKLDEYYRRAREMLGSKPYPQDKTPPKLAALEKVGEGLKRRVKRPDINVSFEDGFNHAGIWQAACTDCGDCVSGCNYGAKNTTLMNYLPDAERHGAELYTGAEVVSLARKGTSWEIHVRDISDKTTTDKTIQAEIVILAAGTLGTNEILLRSKGLSLSGMLGHHFSGNGDIWAFGYNANIEEGESRAMVHGVGAGGHDVAHGFTPEDQRKYKPGPCITGFVDMRDENRPLKEGLIVEEGVMPGALAAAYAAGFPAFAALEGDPFRFGDIAVRMDDAEKMGKKLKDDPLGFVEHVVYEGTVARTLPFLVMSHDSSTGQLLLEDNGRVTVNWAGAGQEKAIRNDAQVVRDGSDAIRAEYLPNPIWLDALDNRLLTVHPLGGCAMAENAEKGVINHKCQVFNTATGGVYESLYVCDGSAIPRALGVNPHLTITAVAEYAMQELADDRGWAYETTAGRQRLGDGPSTSIEPDPVALLGDALEGLRAIKSAIDAKAYELARLLLLAMWRQFVDLVKSDKLCTAEQFVKQLGTDERLQTVIQPILGKILDWLTPVHEALEKNAYLEALDIAEKKIGDFSPPACFAEAMSGHVSDEGLDDPEAPFDAYSAAGAGDDNFWLTAEISAEAVRSAINPPFDAVIRKGVVKSALLGEFDFEGAFRFLVPNDSSIECWNMIYEGRMTSTTGGKDLEFCGCKTLQQREGSHWWRDLTELRVEIKETEGKKKAVARGVIRVSFDNVLDQANNLSVEYDEEALKSALDDVIAKVLRAFLSNPEKLPGYLDDEKFRVGLVKSALYMARAVKAPDKLAQAYQGKVFAKMGGLVLRSYGGVFAYGMNFPSQAEAPKWPTPDEVYHPEVAPGVHVKLSRFGSNDASRGPVVLAGGFGTKAMSFATPTIDRNLVQMLQHEGFDVWLFDYRGCGDLEANRTPFTLDDVAQKDWPAALRLVTERTQREKVPVIVHCIGSMTLFMALLAGEKRVHSVIASQLGVHAITNWFNFAKGDSNTANWIANGAPKKLLGLLKAMNLDKSVIEVAKHGLPVLDPRSPSVPPNPKLDPVLDGLVWNVPSFAPVPCKSPTCHRINMIFGPSYRHDQLNQATHDAIADMFGAVSSAPFLHISKIFETGHVLSMDGSIDYMDHADLLRLPIHFVAGARNQEMLPEASLRTMSWLEKQNPKQKALYSRHVFPEYGHMDCFIGKTSSEDVFPHLIKVLKDQTKTG